MTALGASLLAAFLVGMGGGAHCALMCGGIAATIVAGAPRERANWFAGCSQAGRIASYALAGAIMAALSAGVLSFLADTTARTMVHVLLGLAWIGIALQLLGWLGRMRLLAAVGAAFWKRLQPLTRRIWPINTPLRALAAGALWGWLPCGMSYAMLMVAAATADPLQAALVMLVFGIGSMPGTILPALAAVRMQRLGVSAHFRQIAAVAMLALGVFTLAAPWTLGNEHAHHLSPAAAGADPAHLHHQH